MAQFSLCLPSSSSFLTFSLERGSEMSSSSTCHYIRRYTLLGSSLVFHNFCQHMRKKGHSISRNRRRLQYKMEREREREIESLFWNGYTLVLLYNRCWLLYCLFLDPLLLQQEWRRRRRQRYYWNHKVSTPLFFIFFLVCIAQNVCGLLSHLSLSLSSWLLPV